jgi:hypothetical protein
VDNPYCEVCNEEESVCHFLLECSRFEDIREKLTLNIFRTCGVGSLSEQLLLAVGSNDEFSDYRTDINRHLGEFIAQANHI